MNDTMREIRRLAREIGEGTYIRRKDFTVYIDDDQATFDRWPEGMQHAIEVLRQVASCRVDEEER